MIMWRPRLSFLSRRLSGGQTSVPDGAPGVLWWVPLFTDWGRPLAAVVVLVLCAPGEQHLAYLAGWNGERAWLSWGFAGLLSLYAGISAVVATIRPRGSKGKATAVLGAILSLLLAMTAQPVSHMFVTGWLSAEPRPPLWLVIIVSGIPPFILGHLLHLAASPVRTTGQVQAGQPDKDSGQPVPSGAVKGKARRPVRPVCPAEPDKAPRTAPTVSLVRRADTDSSSRPVPIMDKQNLSARAAVLASTGQDKDTIKDTLRTEFPDAKPDSIRKAAERAADKVSAVN